MGNTISEALSPSSALREPDEKTPDNSDAEHVPLLTAADCKRGDAIYYIFSLSDHAKQGNPELRGTKIPDSLLAKRAPPKGGVHLALDLDAFAVDARARHVGVFVGTVCIPCRRAVAEHKEECDTCFAPVQRDVVIERMNEETLWISSDDEKEGHHFCSLDWVESRKGSSGEGRKIAVLWSTFGSFLRRAARLHMPVWKLAHAIPKQIHPDEIAARALYFLGAPQVGGSAYSLLDNNCEHFAVWCRTDSLVSPQVQYAFQKAYEGAIGVLGAAVVVFGIMAFLATGGTRESESSTESGRTRRNRRVRGTGQQDTLWEIAVEGAVSRAVGSVLGKVSG